MPVDPELVDPDDCDEGTLLVLESGRTLRVGKENITGSGFEREPQEPGYVSHFATCLHASEARKR